ncbi:hypothetical protein C1H46_000385 [Malus baccata]|uniref:Uncharacterized protein n=1 Tax=Malus baccata TaxID=106549 RepID=A0A540NTI7_MALBA|nr:hypothetical protein C1H46_000385 [Malus baccata]
MMYPQSQSLEYFNSNASLKATQSSLLIRQRFLQLCKLLLWLLLEFDFTSRYNVGFFEAYWSLNVSTNVFACSTLCSSLALAGSTWWFQIGFRRSGGWIDCSTPVVIVEEKLTSLDGWSWLKLDEIRVD